MSGGTASQYRPDGERSEARGDSNLGGARGIEAVRTHAGGLMLRGLFLASVIAAAIGGWAVITVEQLPDYVTAGRPVTLSFTVRQHGVTRLSGLKPSIEARSGDLTTTATASPGRETGQYVSTLSLPRAGEWTITIHSGFLDRQVTLLPLAAIAAGAAAPPPPPAPERGDRKSTRLNSRHPVISYAVFCF